MSDTGSGEMPTTPRWAGVHRPESGESAEPPMGDPTASDAWGVRSFSPYDAASADAENVEAEPAADAPHGTEEAEPASDAPHGDEADTPSAGVEPTDVPGVSQDESVRTVADEAEGEADVENAEGIEADASDESVDEPTEVMAPVGPEPDAEASDPDDVSEETATPGEASDEGASDDVEDSPSGNPLGVWAVVTGILLIFPAAIALGHLGLRAAAREGRARTAAFAGMLLGYLGLVVAGAGVALWLLVFGPALETAEQELQAQADVTAVGSAVAAHFEDSATEPELTVSDTGYLVDDVAVEGLLTVERDVAFTFESTTDWCVELTFADAAASYVGATGYSATACG